MASLVAYTQRLIREAALFMQRAVGQPKASTALGETSADCKPWKLDINKELWITTCSFKPKLSALLREISYRFSFLCTGNVLFMMVNGDQIPQLPLYFLLGCRLMRLTYSLTLFPLSCLPLHESLT